MLYQGTKAGKWIWTDQMEAARLKLLRMALESGELERRDETLPLHVCVTEQDEEVTLTVSNEGGHAPIAFLTHQQEAMRRYDENSAERILAAVKKTAAAQSNCKRAANNNILYGRRARQN